MKAKQWKHFLLREVSQSCSDYDVYFFFYAKEFRFKQRHTFTQELLELAYLRKEACFTVSCLLSGLKSVERSIDCTHRWNMLFSWSRKNRSQLAKSQNFLKSVQRQHQLFIRLFLATPPRPNPLLLRSYPTLSVFAYSRGVQPFVSVGHIWKIHRTFLLSNTTCSIFPLSRNLG